MVRLFEARFPHDRDDVATLFREYAESLGFDLCFQGFDKELADLPGKYAAPNGCVLLADVDECVVGCVALRPLDELGVCEMKRLYVKPKYRNVGAGRMLAEAIVDRARTKGYSAMRLDTIATMHSAIRLYQHMGFVRIEPYCHNPIPEAVYMELRL